MATKPPEYPLVLGLDLSLERTGMASLDHTSGAIATRAVDNGGRLGHARLQYIVKTVELAAEQHDLVGLEARIGAAGRFQPDLLGLWLMVKHAVVWTCGLPVVLVYPSTRAKYSGAGGGAKKRAVHAATQALYPDLTLKTDDEADALLVALIAARVAGEPFDGEISKDRYNAVNNMTVERERR